MMVELGFKADTNVSGTKGPSHKATNSSGGVGASPPHLAVSRPRWLRKFLEEKHTLSPLGNPWGSLAFRGHPPQ